MKGKSFRNGAIALLAGTVLAGAGIEIGNGMAAFAQEAAQKRHDFNIAAKPIRQAMNDIVRVTGVDVVFPETAVASAIGRPVQGSLTTSEAIATLLQGSGLRHGFTNGNTVTIADTSQSIATGSAAGATELTPIVVKGDRSTALLGDAPPAYAGGQVANGGQLGMLGNRSIMNTPFNAASYTAKTLENQQSRSIADVTKNDPSVRSTWADGSYSNQFFVRGFPLANPDISIAGLYGLVPYQMSGTSWVERVEVLKGPSALLSGMPPQGSIGGAINLVPKRATDEPITRFTGNYVSNGQVGGKVDFGRRFGDGGELGVRANGSFLKGNAPVDGQANELGEASLGLDYRGERLRLSADLVYQKNDADNPARPIYVRPGFKVPAAPDASLDLGQDWYFSEGKDVLGIVRGEFDITDDITAYASLAGRHNDFLGLYNFSYLKNATGDFDANNYYQPTYNDSVTGEIGVRSNFDTGPIRHELNVGLTGLYNELGVVAPIVSTYASNIYNPGRVLKPNLAGFLSEAPKTSAVTLTSLAVTDSLYMLDDRLQLILGARHQNVRQKGWNATTGVQTADYNESAVTPAIGVVVKPWDNVSFYANYIEGLSQGPVAPATAANAGAAFAPIRSKQYEAGVKVDFGQVTATASIFQIEQPSGFLDARTNTYGLNGEIRNRGVEINIFGELTNDIRMLGGIAFMDGVQTKTAGGVTDGKKAVGIPDVQLNLGAEWDTPFIEGLTLTGRVVHTSAQYVSNDNSQDIPAWTRFDLGARYVVEREKGKPVTIRASVENLFDRSYWAAASSNFGLARGAPRTFLLSTTFDF